MHYPMGNSNMKISLLLTLILVLLMSCRSSRGVVSDGSISDRLTTKQLIRENGRRDAKFKTLQAKIKIDIFQDGSEQGYSVTLRMEKEKTIWISATLGLARAKITPDQVQFYDKINKQYFDGDYSLLSNLLGIELNFDQVQSLLIGEPIFNLKNEDYEISNNESSYVLAPKNQNPLLELFLLFNPTHFKMDSQQLSQPQKMRFLELDYTNYQVIEKEILPKNIKIIAIEENEELNVELEYKSVSLNQDLRFPFKIPSRFEEIKIEDVK